MTRIASHAIPTPRSAIICIQPCNGVQEADCHRGKKSAELKKSLKKPMGNTSWFHATSLTNPFSHWEEQQRSTAPCFVHSQQIRQTTSYPFVHPPGNWYTFCTELT